MLITFGEMISKIYPAYQNWLRGHINFDFKWSSLPQVGTDLWNGREGWGLAITPTIPRRSDNVGSFKFAIKSKIVFSRGTGSWRRSAWWACCQLLGLLEVPWSCPSQRDILQSILFVLHWIIESKTIFWQHASSLWNRLFKSALYWYPSTQWLPMKPSLLSYSVFLMWK